MKTKKIIVASLLSLTAVTVFGQNEFHTSTEPCLFNQQHERLLNENEEYRKNMEQNEAFYQTYLKAQHQEEKTIKTIPVVVHVIHVGEAIGSGTNISDAQIQSAISSINDAYSKAGNFANTNGVNTQLQFCLAVQDPNGATTTGINRVNGSSVNDFTAHGLTTSGTNNEVDVKALSKWPNDKYYNVWIVGGIDGNMGGNGKHGFAYFPGTPANKDGAVILYNAFGTTGNLGSDNQNTTFIHETGHALSLYHTFQGDGSGSTCPGNTTCGQDSDCVDDTPPHMRTVATCNLNGTNSCDNNSANTLYMNNFMNYGHCTNMFTAGQTTRINAALAGSRAGWLTSLGCQAVTTGGGNTGSGAGITSTTADQTLSFSPNPSNGKLQVTIPASFELNSIIIYNEVGKIVKQFEMTSLTESSKNSYSIDLSELATGNYFVKINDEAKMNRITLLK